MQVKLDINLQNETNRANVFKWVIYVTFLFLNSNLGSPVLEATTLSTVPQQLRAYDMTTKEKRM